MAVLGALASGICGCVLANKRGLDGVEEIFVALFAFLGVFVGGVFLFALTNIPYFIRIFQHSADYPDVLTFLNALLLGFGGSVFYGGMLCALLCVYIYTKRQKMDTALQFDILAVCIPLFHAFGRIGCFLGGCCYGIESEFGFTFTQSPIEFANGVNRFPVQLLEAAVLMIIFLVLLQLFNKKIFSKNLILIYFLLYGGARFFIEFLRDDFYRGIWGALSTSQWISIVLVIVAIVFLIRIGTHRVRQVS